MSDFEERVTKLEEIVGRLEEIVGEQAKLIKQLRQAVALPGSRPARKLYEDVTEELRQSAVKLLYVARRREIAQ